MNSILLNKIKDFFLKGEKSLISNIVKSLLIGLLVGILIGFTGSNWDFEVHWKGDGYSQPTDEILEAFGYYGTTQAILGGIIVSLSLFLIYNKKSN